MIKRIGEGSMLPAWYGVAWRDLYSNQAVCLPIGLNLVAALCRNAYYTIKFAGRAVASNPRDAYAQGLRDGRRARTP